MILLFITAEQTQLFILRNNSSGKFAVTVAINFVEITIDHQETVEIIDTTIQTGETTEENVQEEIEGMMIIEEMTDHTVVTLIKTGRSMNGSGYVIGLFQNPLLLYTVVK